MSAWRARIFPGSRTTWLGALIVGLIFVFWLARFGESRIASLTGTNSVDVASVITHAEPGHTVCIRDLVVPSRTARVGVSLAALTQQPGSRIDANLVTSRSRVRLRADGQFAGLGYHNFALPTTTAATIFGASVCLTPRRMALDFGGAFVQRLPGAPSTTLDTKAIGMGDVSVEFLRPVGDSLNVFSALPRALERSTVFESPVGKLLTWLALPFLALAFYLVARVTATAETSSIRRLAAIAATLAFGHAICWAVLLHPFHGADEAEHFAYAQYLAATNHQPDRGGPSSRSPYSSSQQRLLEALHQNSTILNATSRPRWDKTWEKRYKRVTAGTSDSDGGGGNESASGHSPFYYWFIGLPYRALHTHMSLYAVLLCMRVLNAALAALVAALAVLAASAFFRGGRPQLCWVAGVLVAFQPVFGSVGGSVNNDTAVNFAAATLLTVLMRSWAYGPTPERAAAAGGALAVLPLAKITGFGVYPAGVVATLVLATRYRFRAAARWLGVAVGVLITLALIWIFAASPVLSGQRGTLHNVHPAAPVTGGPTAGPAPLSPAEKVDYFAQTFLPGELFRRDLWQLPGTGPIERNPVFYIYVRRGYGLFGWKSADLSQSLLRGITASLILGWMMVIIALTRSRGTWRDWLGGVSILLSAIVSVLAFVSYAFASRDVHTDAGEQGRYIFTAIVPLAVIFSTAPLALNRRWVAVASCVMACGAVSLGIMAWLSALRSWFM